MYDNIKSCVKCNKEMSGYFASEIGVRQGENLSPFLFAISLSDLEYFFEENNIDCLKSVQTSLFDELGVYVKIFVLLYADDTILLSESQEGLHI